MITTIHKATSIALAFAAAISSAALAGDKKSEEASEKAMKASIERQERIISLREQMEKELGFTLELIKDDQGLDSLLINTSNLPATGEMYSIYVCWLDEPATSGGRPQDRMVKIGRIRGSGRSPEKNGESSVTSGKSSATLRLNVSHAAAPGGYYGRGRACAMAVSNKGIYASNIVTVPEKPQEAGSEQDGADQPATAPESKPKGKEKPKPSAKRAAPKPVSPVVANSVEYSAPHEQMGFVVATDVSSRKELWRVRIYTVHIDPSIERDVQDIFITSLSLEHGRLVITNERGDRYSLDLVTRKVAKHK